MSEPPPPVNDQPPRRLRETGYAESLVAQVARKSKLPTREVWLPSGAGWQSASVDPAEVPDVVRWTEVGEFETLCRDCGSLIPVEPFLGDDRQRLRFVRRLAGDDHVCHPNSWEQRGLRAKNAFLAWLDNPDDETVGLIQRAAHLPDRFFPGLHRLVKTGENAGALMFALEMLERFQAGQRDRGLYLWGGIGTGKSAISKALAFDLAFRTGEKTPRGWKVPLFTWGAPARVQWWSVPRMFAEMAKRWDRLESEYDPGRIERCDCLVLDDLGKEHPSGFKKSELFRLLNDRYDNSRALVVTSNYPPEELASRMVAALGPDSETELVALFDRICSAEVCDVIELPGESWRRRRAA